MRREVLTAKNLSRNLKEHEEAFKSRNGYEVEPPPEVDGDVSGIIAQIVLLEKVSERVINEAARKIRDLSERKIKYMRASLMIYQAMGYKDRQEAAAFNSDPDFIANRNFGRKDPGVLADEITAERLKRLARAKELLTPFFDEVKSWDNFGWFGAFASVPDSKARFLAAAIQYVAERLPDAEHEYRLGIVCALSWRFRPMRPERRKCARVFWIGTGADVYQVAQELGDVYWPKTKGETPPEQ